MAALSVRTIAVCLACGVNIAGSINWAAAQSAPAADGSGAEIVAAKCSQCHSDAMWREQRQDRRAWEATLYRMIGRGAAWEPDEINSMADYLGSDFGLSQPRPVAGAAKK